MNYQPIFLGAFLILYYNISESHVFDAHLPSGEESMMMLEAQKERENRNAQRVIDDEDSSEDEKDDAYDTLIKNGAIV